MALVATVLAFSSGAIVSDTAYFASSAERYLANTVGMYASVPANEVNTLNAALTERAGELERREREIDARAREGSFITDPRTIYALSAILLIQLVLILANYAFDFRRAKLLTQQV
jgi:hypothetical protein